MSLLTKIFLPLQTMVYQVYHAFLFISPSKVTDTQELFSKNWMDEYVNEIPLFTFSDGKNEVKRGAVTAWGHTVTRK